MRKRTFAAGVLALICAAPTTAQTWEVIPASPSSYTISIDTSSIRRSGDDVSYLQRTAFPELRSTPSGTQFDETITETQANCASMSLRPVRISARLAGKVVLTGEPGVPVTSAPPGTNFYAELSRVCALSSRAL